ncbi:MULTISPECIES: MFS transporter [Rhodomicrobium]|uniref:MFS transporter n=1 Tax=Rhodomicrobium TaxID=1068 RepID=UPI001FD90F9F|nr:MULTISPECIES: MFS transporter [Rhodomicrobium]
MGQSLVALNALNFFMADVRDGLGPFLGVFLQQNGWSPAHIGLVTTLGGLAGVAATTPLGMLVDTTSAKRAIVILSACAVILACSLNYILPYFGITAAAQMASGIAGAAIGPAIAAITLGLVRQKGFPRQLGRNEAYNHAGNAFAAILCGILGYMFGLVAVFVLMGLMALGSIVATLWIDPNDIDNDAARGLKEQTGEAEEAPSSFLVLLQSKPLIVLALTLLLFHLANAAMLPILGQAMVARGSAGDPSAYTAATVIIAQMTMIPMALLASRLAQTRGYWIVFVLALVALPIRGLIAGTIVDQWVLVPVQVLDGVGAGLLGVAVPGLVARILNGTGRINSGLAAVMTMQGVGAASSPALAGLIAEDIGYWAAFLAMGAIAAAALALWLLATPIIGAACAGGDAPDEALAPA